MSNAKIESDAPAYFIQAPFNRPSETYSRFWSAGPPLNRPVNIVKVSSIKRCVVRLKVGRPYSGIYFTGVGIKWSFLTKKARDHEFNRILNNYWTKENHE